MNAELRSDLSGFEIEILPGMHIKNCLLKALTVAIKTGAPAFMTFNHITIVVHEDSNIFWYLDQYDKLIKHSNTDNYIIIDDRWRENDE